MYFTQPNSLYHIILTETAPSSSHQTNPNDIMYGTRYDLLFITDLYTSNTDTPYSRNIGLLA